MNYQERMMQESLGITAGVHVNDTTKTDGIFFAFQVISEAVIADLEEAGVGIVPMAGVTLAAGFVYYGPITSITLTSGYVKLFAHTDPYTHGPSATVSGRS